MSADFDDDISIAVEEYFKLTHYIADTPYPEARYRLADLAAVQQSASFVTNSQASDNFTCPNQNTRYPGPDVFGTTDLSMPFIHAWGSQGYVARIGYSYLAGFETENWNWASLTISRKWLSPDKKTDRGDRVLICDRNRFLNNVSMVVHAGGGGRKSDIQGDARETYGKADTNIGYLDGSVKSVKLRDTLPRQVTMNNGELWDVGEDCNFF